MSAVPPDYDRDPSRWLSHDRSTYTSGDTHELVAERLRRHADGGALLDIGCGDGQLLSVLPRTWSWFGLDSSPAQLARLTTARAVRGDAGHLPFRAGSFDAAAALWMLYHLSDPVQVVREAFRVLRDGGIFFACTSARDNDPELTDGYPLTSFDAEEAPELVASVFGHEHVELMRWDAPMVVLPDHAALQRYLRSHHLPSASTQPVSLPLHLTKRGCLVTAHKVEHETTD